MPLAGSSFIESFHLLCFCPCLLISPQAQAAQVCPSLMPREPVEYVPAHHVRKAVPFL